MHAQTPWRFTTEGILRTLRLRGMRVSSGSLALSRKYCVGSASIAISRSWILMLISCCHILLNPHHFTSDCLLSYALPNLLLYSLDFQRSMMWAQVKASSTIHSSTLQPHMKTVTCTLLDACERCMHVPLGAQCTHRSCCILRRLYSLATRFSSASCSGCALAAPPAAAPALPTACHPKFSIYLVQLNNMQVACQDATWNQQLRLDRLAGKDFSVPEGDMDTSMPSL